MSGGEGGAIRMTEGVRPRVFLLVDRPGWAFHHAACALAHRLSGRFDLRLIYQGVETCDLDPAQVDLLYVFWWGDQTYRHLRIPPERILKEVASHRWQLDPRFGRIDAATFAGRYLDDCGTVITPSLRLFELLDRHCANLFHCPNGVDPARFSYAPRRWPGLRIAWSGNPNDDCKGLGNVLVPACADRFALERTDGRRTHAEVAALYARSDVIAVASEAEGEPLPLLEAMASGCFPVTTDVGIARELIVPGVNGLIAERTPEAFRRAFQWCEANLADVRRAGRLNARLIAAERDWDQIAERYAAVFDAALGRGPAPARVWQPAHSAARDAVVRGAVPARFAFLTPEYTSDDTLAGGLGAYVRNTAHALASHGHEAEVFTTAPALAPEPDGAASVHRVPDALSRRWVRAALVIFRALRIRRAAPALRAAVDAWALARAFAARERSAGFDAVQSADFGATGLFVSGRRRRHRPHLVRASSDQAELAVQNGGDPGWRAWLDALQRRCLRRADVAYAPSRFLARHYAARHGIYLRVAAPPAPPRAALGVPPEDLPKRYFVHFGQLSPAKGSADLAAALPLVWEQAPDFEMVWAGIDRGHLLPAWRAQWGARREQVHWLGELPHAELLAVVAQAEAAVLPSRFDNLPNSVIECLSLGVPVIGTIGASIDELVTPGRDGDLVPIGDREALAGAIAARWRAAPSERCARLPAALDPAAAVDRLLGLASLRNGPVDR
jgi:glycosyltransferase involved in cell wall biosynthesis